MGLSICCLLGKTKNIANFMCNANGCHQPAHRASEAKALYTLIDQSFTVNFTFMKNILWLTKTMSDHLQSPGMQLASAIDLVH